MAALGVVLRGVLASLTLAALTAVTVGVALARFYDVVPILPDGQLQQWRDSFGVAARATAGSLPVPAAQWGVLESSWWAMGALLAVAALAYLGWVVSLGAKGQLPVMTSLGGSLVGAALALAAVCVVVPALMRASAGLVSGASGRLVAGGTLGPVLLTYAGTLAGLLWRNRTSVRSRLARLTGRGGTGTVQSLVPRSLTQRLIVLAALAVLVTALALLAGSVAVTAATWPWWQQLLPPAVLLLLYGVLDQTWLSLHPFYRRRLASAIAVRRGSSGGRAVAVPYAFTEHTGLSRYGHRVPGFPQVLFAAAANLSGQSRTPPGRRAVGITLASDWVGGPDLGYVRTERLEEVVSVQMRRDVTVQAAVAVSGAAFASAMGRQARAFETFLALSNARLGTWLPNPAFLLTRAQRADDWTLPQLPRLRRLTYLWREVTASFPDDDRLLLCTDGGHYENLGLVELLRLRARLVYCLDASGDSPPFATALAEAITLAREELGVVVELERRPRPGAGQRDAAGPGRPAGRPQRPAEPVRGDHAAPSATRTRWASPTAPSDVGTIVVAKASLTADLPYPVLAYAQGHPAFPRDTTSDQWFDHGQFDAYTELGRALGRAAVPVPVLSDQDPPSFPPDPGTRPTTPPPPYPGDPLHQLAEAVQRVLRHGLHAQDRPGPAVVRDPVRGHGNGVRR